MFLRLIFNVESIFGIPKHPRLINHAIYNSLSYCIGENYVRLLVKLRDLLIFNKEQVAKWKFILTRRHFLDSMSDFMLPHVAIGPLGVLGDVENGFYIEN